MNERVVVIWSGGADSTLALCEAVSQARRHETITAISVTVHSNITLLQLQEQNARMDKFLAWAKKRDWKIDHRKVRIDHTCIDLPSSQGTLWLCSVAPYLPDHARIWMGYIRRDDFWHEKAEHVAAAEALAKLSDRKWKIEFPLEWSEKWEVLRALKKWKVPDSLWWTCESPVKKSDRIKACRQCLKCREVAAARALWKEKEKEFSKMHLGKKLKDPAPKMARSVELKDMERMKA